MPRRYTPKPFNPKPFDPGAPITWRHTTADGATVERSGTVWSGARPMYRGRAVWVTPDVALPGDGYRALYVEIPTQRRGASTDALLPYASDTGALGDMTAGAARAANAVRIVNARHVAA